MPYLIICEAERKTGDGEWRIVDEGVIDALGEEEEGEDAPVSGEDGERDPGVVGSGNTENLALVGVDLGGSFISCGKGRCGCGHVGAETDAGGALLASLHSILERR